MFLGGAIPAGVALVIALVVRILLTPFRSDNRWSSAMSVGVGAGLAVGIAYVVGASQAWPPVGSTGWLFWLAPAVGIVVAIVSLPRLPGWMRWIFIFLITAGAAYLLFQNRFQNGRWTSSVGALWLAGISLAVVVWQMLFNSIARRAGNPGLLVSILSTGLTSAILLTVSDSIARGRFEGALVGATTAGVIIALIFRGSSLAPGLSIVFSILTMLLIALGTVALSERSIQPLHAGLLLMSPLFATLADVGPLKRLKTWKREFVRALLALLPGAAAIALATPKFLKTLE